jgi:hypothetical protein
MIDFQFKSFTYTCIERLDEINVSTKMIEDPMAKLKNCTTRPFFGGWPSGASVVSADLVAVHVRKTSSSHSCNRGESIVTLLLYPKNDQ